MKLLLYFIAAVSTSTMGGSDSDSKMRHLNVEFLKMLDTVGNLLEMRTSVDTLKKFLQCYSHPLYPEKRYIDPRVYREAKTVRNVLFSLCPQYINFMQSYDLEEIVHEFGNDECKHHFLRYKHMFQRSVHKLRDDLAPVTDEEIEQYSGRNRLKVTTSDDVTATTPHDLLTVQGAIEQATGVGQAGQVFAHQDPGD